MFNLKFNLILVFVVLLTASNVLADVKLDSSIYVDPLFGGEEIGPVFDQKYMAKTLTLDIGQKLKKLFLSKSIKAHLSRDKDTFIAIDERLSIAKMADSKAYLAISLSKSNKDCIHIYYPKQENEVTEKKKKELSTIMEQALKRAIASKSSKLAELISRNTKKHAGPICIETQPQRNYLLDNTSSPIVVIDFGISDSNKAFLYIMDAVQMDKILNAVADATEEYLSFYPQPNKKGIEGEKKRK